jgi:hypothetical protein
MTYPIAKIAAGRGQILDGTASATLIYQVTEGRKFSPESIVITNFSGQTRVTIYDGVSNKSYIKQDLIAPPEKTTVLDEKMLRGIEFISGVVVNVHATSGVFVHVGGFEW